MESNLIFGLSTDLKQAIKDCMWVKRIVHSTIKKKEQLLMVTLKLRRGQGRV